MGIIALAVVLGWLMSALLCGIIGYVVGTQKGNGGLGFVLGFFLLAIGILVAVLLQDNRPPRRKFTPSAAYYRSRDAGHSYSQFQDQRNTTDWLKNLN